MNKCPRCHSSMLMDFTDSMEGFRRMWKCIGCGRELLQDVGERVEDERLVEQIRRGTTTA